MNESGRVRLEWEAPSRILPTSIGAENVGVVLGVYERNRKEKKNLSDVVISETILGWNHSKYEESDI